MSGLVVTKTFTDAQNAIFASMEERCKPSFSAGHDIRVGKMDTRTISYSLSRAKLGNVYVAEGGTLTIYMHPGTTLVLGDLCLKGRLVVAVSDFVGPPPPCLVIGKIVSATQDNFVSSGLLVTQRS